MIYGIIYLVTSGLHYCSRLGGIMSLILRMLPWLLAMILPHQATHLYAGEPNTKEILAENDHYRVILMGEGEPRFDPSTGGRVKFTFLVTDKVKEHPYPVYLDNIASKISQIKIFEAKLIVFGEEAALHSSIITLIGLHDGKEIDSMAGFGTTMSETGRYLSYRKFYPLQTADPPVKSDLVLIYDLSDSPDGNRLRGEAAYRNDPIGRLIEVGHPVYPETNASKKNYRVWIRDEKGRHTIIPKGFFWFDDDRKIAFGDQVGGENYLVVIDISNGLDKPIIHKKWINILPLLRPEDRQDDSLINEAKRLSLEGIQGMNNGMVRLRISSVIPLSTNELELQVEDAEPIPSIQPHESVKSTMPPP